MLHRTSSATAAAFLLLIATVGFIEVEGKVGFGPGEQEWGYITVRPHAHMFWWLYYATSRNATDAHQRPLIIWLQGGPGMSSTGYGNFEELGPLDADLNPRNLSWVKDYNVLFIDNPTGAGFSYADSFIGYARNNAQIAGDLLECVRGFFREFPNFADVPTYITAESYGGKMAAEFALVWNRAQKAGEIVSNFQGVALGDSWISPIDSVLSWASYLLDTGLVDTEGMRKIERVAKYTKSAVDNENWLDAVKLCADTEEMILDVTGNVNFYNILERVTPPRRNWNLSAIRIMTEKREAVLDRLMNGEVKKTLGLNATWTFQKNKVFMCLLDDIMRPVTNIVEQLLNETGIEVFVFNGQLDLIVATPGTLAWIENLKWRNATEWREASRRPVVVDDAIEGYVKEYRNFKMYWINRAGHMVPRDNPAALVAMLKHLTAKANFNVRRIPKDSSNRR